MIHSPLVLILDDDPRNLRLASDVLRSAGFRVLEAASGGEAIAIATEQQPDVILLDLRLRDMDGVEVARQLKSDARTKAIPVLAHSALQLDSETGWLQSAGFAGSIRKPISVSDFPAQVRSYCNR